MTLPVRRIAMMIAVLLMTHFVGMAVDPHGMHADVPDGSSHEHATTMSHGYGMSAHTGHGVPAPGQNHDLTALPAWECIDTEGVTTEPRVPLEPEAFAAVLPAPMNSDLHPCGEPLRGWEPPTPGAGKLRVLLQVFLN